MIPRAASQTLQQLAQGYPIVAITGLRQSGKTTLAVPLEELFGETSRTANKRGRTSRLKQQIEAISQLPRTQQHFVSQMLDTVLAQAARQPKRIEHDHQDSN